MILQATENWVIQTEATNNYLPYIPWWKQYFTLFSSSGPVAITSLAEGGNTSRQCREMRQMCTYALGSIRAGALGLESTENFLWSAQPGPELCAGLKVLPLGLHREHGSAQGGEEEKKRIAQVETLHLFAQTRSLEIKKAAHISSRFLWNKDRTALWLMVIGCFSWTLMFNTKRRWRKKKREENPFLTNP